MSKLLAILGLILLLSAALSRREKLQKQQAIEHAFANRTKLSAEDFHRLYFNDIPQFIVIGIREILEQQLETDFSRLQDQDDFGRNLKFFWDFDSMADVEIVIALEKRFNIHIEDFEAENASSIRDIVLLVRQKLAEKDAL